MVEPTIGPELGMEREGEVPPMPDGDSAMVERRDCGRSLPDPGRDRRPDEDRVERRLQIPHGEFQLEGLPLPSKGVPGHCHIDKTERVDTGVIDFAGSEDHSCAGSEDTAVIFQEGAAHPVLLDQTRDGGRLASRHGETVELVQLVRVADGDHRKVVARPFAKGGREGGRMLGYVSLEG